LPPHPYPLSLLDALPISGLSRGDQPWRHDLRDPGRRALLVVARGFTPFESAIQVPTSPSVGPALAATHEGGGMSRPIDHRQDVSGHRSGDWTCPCGQSYRVLAMAGEVRMWPRDSSAGYR